ncbi:MAG: hypothetical protein II956_01135 [Bacteroidales bacterium]|nr:hypothetical protein [Bacteroidales bacterium]
MKKTCFIFVCLLFSVFYSCLKPVEEYAVPEMTISYSETDEICFSEIQTASVNVKITCDDDLLGFKMSCDPPRWRLDTTFNSYTHKAEFNLNFSHQKGYAIEDADSVYKVTFMAYTANDSIYARRTLKYKFVYPAIDSFDVELGVAPGQPCLVDIKNRTAYPYLEFSTHNFDLVLINEQRPFYTSVGIAGVALVSPDAQAYLSGYFETVNKLLPPYEEDYLHFRETKIGYINPKAINNSLLVNEVVVGTEDGWSQIRMEFEGQDLGSGLHDLKRGTLYKCQLYDGSYAVFLLTSKSNATTMDAKIGLRVYYQK